MVLFYRKEHTLYVAYLHHGLLQSHLQTRMETTARISDRHVPVESMEFGKEIVWAVYIFKITEQVQFLPWRE